MTMTLKLSPTYLEKQPSAPQTAAVDPHIVFEGVEKIYAGTGAAALKDASFTIGRGRIFGVIGRSGAGKSTLLRSINMLERPTSGRVLIDGVDVGALNEGALEARRRRIGMIFQHFNLMSAKTVRENIALPLKVAGTPAAEIKRKVESLLEMVDLSDKADVYPARLSGGQKQRVGIARALAYDPEILLCDEATSALDPETTQSILGLLREINDRLGLTVVLITHDMSVIRSICDEVLVLDHGNVVEHGDVWRVFGNPQAEATRALLSPLRQGAPGDLAHTLSPNPPPKGGQAILSVRLSGEAGAHGVSLASLLAAAPGAVLLHGGVDRIQGHTQGELLLAVPADRLQSAVGVSFPSNAIKVLGYVDDNV